MMLKMFKNIGFHTTVIMVFAVITYFSVNLVRSSEFFTVHNTDLYAQLQQQHGSDVVMYSTQWCKYCAQTREYLQRNQIQYIDLDIESSAHARRQFEQLDGIGTPLLLVKGNLIRGFNRNKIANELGLE